jgi:uridylate kinase
MKKNTSLHILSVGGSIVIPKTGFDPAFLKSFKTMILKKVAKGHRFVLVVGGGATARNYQDAARNVQKSISNEQLDWIGIAATVMNAEFMKALFGEYAYKSVVRDPYEKVRTTKPIIIAAGLKPGCSTDLRAVQYAEVYGAERVYNLSNISYVYTKDPNKYPDAEKIETIDWKQFRKDIVGDTWEPGNSAPFDPIASKLAERLNLSVSILSGKDMRNISKAIDGKSFEGTSILAKA